MLESEKNAKAIHHLNSFLRGELAAVETYRQALENLPNFEYRQTLEQCRRSHSDRVGLLEQAVIARGGEPSFASGVWGALAKAVEGSATLLGVKAAVAVLEEGEDHWRNDYLRDTDKLDKTTQELVMSQLIPEQMRTHDAMSRLKKAVA